MNFPAAGEPASLNPSEAPHTPGDDPAAGNTDGPAGSGKGKPALGRVFTLAGLPLWYKSGTTCHCGHDHNAHLHESRKGLVTRGCHTFVTAGVCACVEFRAALDRWTAVVHVEVPHQTQHPELRLIDGVL